MQGGAVSGVNQVGHLLKIHKGVHLAHPWSPSTQWQYVAARVCPTLTLVQIVIGFNTIGGGRCKIIDDLKWFKRTDSRPPRASRPPTSCFEPPPYIHPHFISFSGKRFKPTMETWKALQQKSCFNKCHKPIASYRGVLYTFQFCTRPDLLIGCLHKGIDHSEEIMVLDFCLLRINLKTHLKCVEWMLEYPFPQYHNEAGRTPCKHG